MDVARSAPPGVHYHADVINLLQSRGTNSTLVRFPIDILFTLVNSTFYTKWDKPAIFSESITSINCVSSRWSVVAK